MAGFSCFLLAVSAYALVHQLMAARAFQHRDTASANKARAREAVLMLALAADRHDKIIATAESIEARRKELFRELRYMSQVRMRVWQHGRLVYNSAPSLPDRLPEVAGSENAWVRWVERDDRASLVVEVMHEVDDSWLLSWLGLRIMLLHSVSNFIFLIVPAWFILKLGLRPLRDVAAVIAARSDHDLSPLPDNHYRELSPLVTAINQLIARLSERVQREHDVLVDAAHELKTPMAAIQLNAHLVLSRAEAGNIAGSLEAGKGLRDAVSRSTHTVHQLLTMERLVDQSLSIGFAQIDVKSFLGERLAVAAPLAFHRGLDIELHAGQPVVLTAHYESLVALVDNLIGNAIKYSPANGKIEVVLERAGAAVLLKVQDQGPGIPPALRAKVFERFYRVPGQHQVGSGLGLAIARRAAEHNGASIRLESGRDGVGLAVLVEFSAKPDTPARG